MWCLVLQYSIIYETAFLKKLKLLIAWTMSHTMPEAQAINGVLSSALWDVVILRFWSALAVKWPSPCYSLRDLEEALEMGVDWSLREGYAWAEDKEHCEEYGRMLQADPNKVSARAKKRGLPQVTLTLEGRRSFFSCFFFWRGGAGGLSSMCGEYIPSVFQSTMRGAQFYLCFILTLLKSCQEFAHIHKINKVSWIRSGWEENEIWL